MKINSINNQYSLNKRVSAGNKDAHKDVSFGFGMSDVFEKAKKLSLPNIYKKAAGMEFVQNGIKALSRTDSFKLLIILESLYLSSWYTFWGLKNKKIDKEQKAQLAVHDVLTFGIGTAGAVYLDDHVSRFVENSAEKHLKKHADFYIKKGKENLKSNPLSELLDTALKTAGKKGSELEDGLKETAGLIKSHLKDITGKEGKLKTFQVTNDKIIQLQEEVKAAVKQSAGDSGFNLKEAVIKASEKFYDLAAARNEAEGTIKGVNVLKKVIIFGFMYRFAGSLLATPLAVKISSKLFPKKNKTAA